LEMGCFKGAVFIDTLGDGQRYEKDLLEFFDYTLLSCETMSVSLDHFKSLIVDALRSLED